tara:strand:- start:3966 stop:5099 length:1134 start_codon:yes stop_codon:yes gene_type:complete
MNRKVLNRPMFARMRDGSIKPVQYAFAGIAISGGSKLLPYVPRGLAAVKNTLPAVISGGKNLITKGKNLIKGGGSAGGGPGTAVGPYLGGGPGLPAVISGAGNTLKGPTIKNILATGGSLLGYNTLADWMSESGDEIKTETEKNDKINGAPDKKKKKKKNGELDILDKEIKKGTLDDLITERIGIFEKHLGSAKDQVKAGGFAALTEFGLNLASARGGNFMDKIARSAKDPLKTFTAIGAAAKDRADKIKMAGVEAGIKADEAQKERDADSTASSAFNQNLATLKAMFTNADDELTIDSEDLVNMAKSGQTTTKKEFFAENYKAFAGKENPTTSVIFTDKEIREILEKGWALVSGEEIVTSGSGGGTTVEEEIIKLD